MQTMNRLLLRRAPRPMALPLRASRTASLIQTRLASTQDTSSAHEPRHIVFDSDVNPTLAPTLTDIQNFIILPSYISSGQRDRVFNPKHRQSLKTNPVIIEIDDITHRFDHIPHIGLPKARTHILKAIGQMETPTDFANLHRLFAGLRHAKRTIPANIWRRVVAILGTKRQIWHAIESARQVKKTNFKVSTPGIAQEMLFWTQMKALESGWGRAETEQALRLTRVVLEMAASPNHKSDHKRDVQLSPLERDPLVLTTPLHLAAALAVGHEGGKDVDGNVASFARQLIGVWPKGKSLAELYPEEQLVAQDHLGGVNYVTKPLVVIPKLAMTLHGLRLAEKVLEPELAAHIGAIADSVQADISKHRSSVTLKEESVAHLVLQNLFDEQGNIKFEVTAQEAALPEQAEPEAKEAEEPAPATEQK